MSQPFDSPRSDRTVWIIAGVLGGAVLLLAACCGGAAISYFWLRNAPEFAALFDNFEDELDRQVQAAIEDHPVIIEHIGAIEHFETDWPRSLDEEEADVFVFTIRGDKGSGTLRAECITIDVENEDVVSGELILDSGEKHQLFPEKPLK